MEKTDISLNYELEPIAFLEGGKGLDDEEKFIYNACHYWDIDCWLLDDLYAKPERLAALKFLKPKTLILGTTGVYKEELNRLIDLFFSLELHSVEYIIFTMNSENVLGKHLSKIPNVKILKPSDSFTIRYDDVAKDRVTFYLLED